MLSVLMATYNRASKLAVVLDAYLRLETPPGGWELFIVDNGSTDETKQVVASFRDRLPVTYLFEARRGKNAALNSALPMLQGDLVVLTDDDAPPRPDWLVQLRIAADAHPEFSIFGGIILPKWEVPPDKLTLYSIYGTDPRIKEGPMAYGIFGANMAIRADIFKAGCRYDTSIGPRGSDYPMGSETQLLLRLLRAGHKAWHCERAVVEHIVDKSQMKVEWVMHRAIQLGRGEYRMDAEVFTRPPRLWLGVPRYAIRTMAAQVLRIAWTTLRLNARARMEARWDLNRAIGVALEARDMHQAKKARAEFHDMTETLASKPIGARSHKVPTVSVIIPAYNTAGYISEALDSVFAQTFKDFEVIVINDGSPDTDELEKVLNPYLERIVYLKQENRGPSAARNAGIRRARGEYIAFLDSDDSWYSEYLSEQMLILQNSQRLDMVYSDSLMYADTPLSGKSYFQVYPPKLPVTFSSLLKGCSILPSHVVVIRKILLEVGLFDEGLHLLEDVDLWLRIVLCGGKIACNKQVLARHRYRPGSQSYVTYREMAEAQLRCMKKFEVSLNLTMEMRSVLQREIKDNLADLATDQGKRFLLSGDFQQAIGSLTKANCSRPSIKLQLTLQGLRVAPHLTRLLTVVWLRLLHIAENLGMFTPGDPKVIKEEYLKSN